MSWLHSLLTGALGTILGGAVAIGCVKWFHIPSFEGRSGYTVVAIALLSGAATTFATLAYARWGTPQPPPHFLKSLASTAATTAAIAAAAAITCRFLAGPKSP